jgi:hypothetical protein
MKQVATPIIGVGFRHFRVMTAISNHSQNNPRSINPQTGWRVAHSSVVGFATMFTSSDWRIISGLWKPAGKRLLRWIGVATKAPIP